MPAKKKAAKKNIVKKQAPTSKVAKKLVKKPTPSSTSKKTNIKAATKKAAPPKGATKKVSKKQVKTSVKTSDNNKNNRTIAKKAANIKKAAVKSPQQVAKGPQKKQMQELDSRPQALNKVSPVSPPKKRMTKAEAEAFKTLGKLAQKWAALQRKSTTQPEPYSMRKTFAPKTPIIHKTMGWGYVLDNKNDRLEVLFKDGIRYLISNYKV